MNYILYNENNHFHHTSNVQKKTHKPNNIYLMHYILYNINSKAVFVPI